MLTCRLGRYDHIGIEAMLYQRALEDRIRRYEGVTAYTTRCGVTPPELLNTSYSNLVEPPLHSGHSRNLLIRSAGAHMSDKSCAVLRQPDYRALTAAHLQLSPRSKEMATRSATARLEQRRAELNKLQSTSQEFKSARNVVPRGTGPDKLWFTSGQYWGKAYIIGLILRHEGLPIPDDDSCFSLLVFSKQKRAWEAMQAESEAPPAEEQPRKKTAIE